MTWTLAKRKLGRAGGIKERNARQRRWDRLYGEGMWAIGYFIEDRFVTQEEALELVYYRSYEAHFREHPDDLEELISTARSLRNPHALATTGVDLQVPAIMDYLERHALELSGAQVVDIGTWQGQASHALSVRLSPLQIKCSLKPEWTLEKYWQRKKCLAVWED